MNEQKNSRPAGTGTTANAKSTKTLQNQYNTNIAKKQAFFCGIICTLVIIMFFVWSKLSERELVPIEHHVREGECLWTIAHEYKPEDMSMSKYMDWVYKHNDKGFIYPGDKIIMGVYEND